MHLLHKHHIALPKAVNTHRLRMVPDKFMVLVTVLLGILGIVMVYESSAILAIRDFGTPYYYAFEQGKWLILGIVSMIITTFIPYQWYDKYSKYLLIIVLFGLCIVLLPSLGVKVMGARRWIGIGSFVFQPSELSKPFLILYMASWITRRKAEAIPFISFLVLLGTIALLLLLEPDMGSLLVIIISMVVIYFISGAPLPNVLILLPLGVGVILALAVISPYRFSRLTTYLDINHDPLGASYQMRQILIALGSGGVFGRGIGQSRQKYAYLPEANTDSIFAIIGEEFGFVGSLGVIGLYAFLVWRAYRIAKRVHDPFGKLVAYGIACVIGIQAGINLGAMSTLLPLTGIPLPLISYGGSSLIVTMAAIGIVLNISRHI
jgi:cell division protein FtsW